MSKHLSLVSQPENRLLRIVTRCSSVDGFIAFYGQYTTADSILLHLSAPDVAGVEQAFAILLNDGSLVMTGRAKLSAATDDLQDGRKLRGLVLEFVELDEASRQVHSDLLAAQFADFPTHLWKSRTPERTGTPAESRLPEPLPPPPAVIPELASELGSDTEPGLASEPEPPSPERAARLPLPPPARARRGRAMSRAGADVRRAVAILAITLPSMALAGLLVGYVAWRASDAHAAVAAPARVEASADAVPAPRVEVTVPPPPVEVVPVVTPDEPEMCSATIMSKPRGARVSWNDEPIGSTPLRGVEVPCGSAVVTWRRRGYKAATDQLSAAPDEPVIVSRRMSRSYQRLLLTSNPPGARFSVNGRNVGTSPTRAYVPSLKKARVKATKPGFEPWSGSVRVKTRKLSVRATLTPAPKKPKRVKRTAKSKKQRRRRRSRSRAR